MAEGMEAIRDTIRKADEALRKANEPADYVGSASAFKNESPPAVPNPEPPRRSPSLPPPERPSQGLFSPVSINDSWRSPQVPHVIPQEAVLADLNHAAIPRMYSSIDSTRLNMARHRSVSPIRARERLATSMSEASTEFLSPQAIEFLKRSGGDVHATQPIRGAPHMDLPTASHPTYATFTTTTPTVQVVQKMPPVTSSPVIEQIIPTKPPGDTASGEYARRLENEINLLREKLHYETNQREDIAEQYKQQIAKYHQTAEDKFQLEQVLNRTMKDAEGVGDIARRLREEQDQRTHAEAQVALLQKQLKQSHTELEESVEGIKKLTRTVQYKDDEIEDLRKRHLLAEEKADAALERAKAVAREEVAADIRMLKEAGEKDGAELRRRLDGVVEEGKREKETLQRKLDEALAAKEASKVETVREVERVRAEEERQKAELRNRMSELTQADSREKQALREQVAREQAALREQVAREKEELRQRLDAAKAHEDRDKDELRRKLDAVTQEKDQSWRAVANLRENLQRCMADLSYANSRLKENDGKMKDKDAKMREAEQNKTKMLQVIEELKRALGETTDLNDAAKEELFFLRGRVRDLEERAQQPPAVAPDRYGVAGRGVSPAEDYRHHRALSPSNYDTPPIPNNLATQPDELRSEEGSEPGYSFNVDAREIEAGVEVQM